ncbi:RNA polymerase II-associated [Emericellopsis atlantica]|uniref:RNA polymerase II-associated n=1 Tax=Emericellopsis atlantica TaxID=2614577 RepID=A0A9P7ZKD8_9HYPO|nr:RNA polymerase II-associated [Emericellopsis atlantica]KAG9253357.1 RNA polymerase II-associated [Emericellopsis atlantica]
MATSRNGERVVHQEYIARIRYSNALPPPPNPPKLLDIPNTGLSSGQYTNPKFASRLAREQPLNIEADAELGMPLDLVGMPGVFDGDERSIQAPAQQPDVHPHDRALLRPLASLGKRKAVDTGVSFLRRTEYISNLATRKPEAGKGAFLGASQKKRIQRSPEAAADSPVAIKRKIERSFALADEELKNHKRVKHPTRKQLQLVDATPLIPDLDAFPDSGAFVTIKFDRNPVAGSSEYDKRLLSSMFRPIDRSQEEEAAFDAAMDLHRANPDTVPKPQNLMNYDFFLPQNKNAATNFRRMFDPTDADHEDESLYTHQAESGPCFQFNRLRAYETSHETELEHSDKYSDEVILSVVDDESGSRQKAVYYYPVLQKSTIRSQRTKNIARTMLNNGDEDEKVVERMDLTVQDPNEDMLTAMRNYREHPFGWEDPDQEEQVEVEEAPIQRQASEDVDGDVDRQAHASESPRRESAHDDGSEEE